MLWPVLLEITLLTSRPNWGKSWLTKNLHSQPNNEWQSKFSFWLMKRGNGSCGHIKYIFWGIAQYINGFPSHFYIFSWKWITWTYSLLFPGISAHIELGWSRMILKGDTRKCNFLIQLPWHQYLSTKTCTFVLKMQQSAKWFLHRLHSTAETHA